IHSLVCSSRAISVYANLHNHIFPSSPTRRSSDLTGPFEGPEQTPLRILVPAFITSELKTAFQIGFTVFIAFLIIDLLVASVLMSLGMMMVPPVPISLPFKLMLFVLADGWHLLLGSLARSFYI